MKRLTYKTVPSDFLLLLNEFKPVIQDLDKVKQYIRNLPLNQHIYILSDDETNKTIGCLTLVIEEKIINNYGIVCHVEDVVVSSSYRGKGLGSKMLDFVKQYAREKKCYKIILNCDKDVEHFYIKNGFYKSSSQMRLDLNI